MKSKLSARFVGSVRHELSKGLDNLCYYTFNFV